LEILLFFFWHFNFLDLGVLSPNIHFNILDLGGLPPRIWISGIRAGYDSMGVRVSCIFQFQIFAAIFNKLQAGMRCDLHIALSWAKQEEFFFFHFFAGMLLVDEFENHI